jgi:UDP-glucuronate 4-epimerase
LGVAKIMVTGIAGFIGFHLGKRLLDRGDEVLGLDNLNPYYDVSLKEARLDRLLSDQGRKIRFRKLDLADREGVARVFADERPDTVVNLAAQAGVRYSLENPHAYVESNLVGFANILEGCRHWGVRHLVFASSSSVYGANTKVPFSVHDNADHPVSLYAATKKSNELMAHSYAHCTTCRPPACAFSPSTAPGDARIWPTSSSRGPYWRESPSTCTTTAT